MRILLDLQSCQSGSRYGGIGRYSLALAKAMIRDRADWEFSILLNGSLRETANEIRSEFRSLIPPSRIIEFAAPAHAAASWDNPDLMHAAELARERFIQALSVDVVHLTSLIEGREGDAITSVGVYPGGPPTAVTLYDLIPLQCQQLYLQDYRTRSHYFDKFHHLKRAAALLSISEFSAKEVAEFIPNYKGVVQNINGGVDSRFRRVARTASWVDPRPKYGIEGRFILYTASFDARKNQGGLIKAYAQLPVALRKRYPLIFVGDSSKEKFSQLLQLGYAHGLGQGEIRFLGRVPDADLVDLYNLCDLFVFPPLREGLGLPVLEAMACGAPVIGSATTAVREVVGRDDATFDPADVSSISAKLAHVLTDDRFRQELREHGAAHVKRYTWEASAASANNVLESIASADIPAEKSTDIRTGKTKTFCDWMEAFSSYARVEALPDADRALISQVIVANDYRTNERLPARRVAWVTTWGTKCGIAVYSANLVQSFPAAESIILAPYLDEDSGASAQNIRRCWKQGPEDSLLDLDKAIEHENIDDVVIHFNYGFFNFTAIRAFILKQIWSGKNVYVFMHATIDPGVPNKRLALIRDALAACSGLFVHSHHDVSRLAKLGISRNVFLLPLGIGHWNQDRVPRVSPLTTIATYGFFLPGKGLQEVVEAVSIASKLGLRLRLKMVNAQYGTGGDAEISGELIKEVKETIRDLGLVDLVELHTDFLSDEESQRILSSADAVLFAYQRTNESASAAVRTGIASGKPVMVTPLPVFDDVREAVFTLPGTRPVDIAQGLIQLDELIRAQSPKVAETIAAAHRLAAANDYTETAKFLSRELRYRGMTQIWMRHYQSDWECVQVAPGREIEKG